MPKTPAVKTSPKPPAPPRAAISVPAFWPMEMAAGLVRAGSATLAKTFKFVNEEIKIHERRRPALATPNVVRLDLRTMALREYGREGGIPTLVDAPYAGHSAMIADYAKGQSLIETLLSHGLDHILLTDWKPATDDMKNFDIDNYLAELIVAIDDLGGRVNLIGLCQGGWMAAMAAARFPEKVNALVLAGAPIDTDAGDGPIKHMSHAIPMAFYEDLVRLGGGLMRGRFMLEGWKAMHPDQHYFREHVDLYEKIDDPVYVAKREAFERWYENPLDLPGRWYLEAIRELFKENRFARGEFIGLGRRLDLKAIVCPVYLLAGDADDITTREQVFNAENYLGTPKGRIEKQLVPGGHIGLFMGSRTLEQTWPSIAQWIMRAGGA